MTHPSADQIDVIVIQIKDLKRFLVLNLDVTIEIWKLVYNKLLGHNFGGVRCAVLELQKLQTSKWEIGKNYAWRHVV